MVLVEAAKHQTAPSVQRSLNNFHDVCTSTSTSYNHASNSTDVLRRYFRRSASPGFFRLVPASALLRAAGHPFLLRLSPLRNDPALPQASQGYACAAARK